MVIMPSRRIRPSLSNLSRAKYLFVQTPAIEQAGVGGIFSSTPLSPVASSPEKASTKKHRRPALSR